MGGASYSSSTTCIFFTILVFLSHQCSNCYCSSLSDPTRKNKVSELKTGEKVSVDLYYESLCPFSANFIVNYLADLFNDENDLLSSVDLHLSPWGNARLKSNSSFSCQHGPYECLLNTVEACAIHVWPDLKMYFAFIYCVESLVYERKYQQWESCFDELELDAKPVLDCYTSGYGTQLELKYAAETNSLQPPHKYVPWVVVDGEPLYEDYENYLSYICKAFKGSAPKACNEVSACLIRGKKARAIIPVCHKDTIISKLSERVKSTIFPWMQQMIGGAAAL